MSDDEFGQAPPHDLGAEQCALGAMLLSREVIAEVAAKVTANSFYRPNHGTIFNTILDLDGRGEPADAYTVAAALADSGDLGRIGGAGYLHTLIETVPTPAMGPRYAQIVADRALSRELLAAGRRICQAAGGGSNAYDALHLAQKLLADLEMAKADAAEGGPRMWADIIPGMLEEIEQAGQATDGPLGIPTGIADLDRMLTGLKPGQVVVVAARPGVGKSVLLGNIAQNASWKHKQPTLIFSLEMSANEMGKRLVAADARVPLHILNTGQLSDNDWGRVGRTCGETSDAPLVIDDTAEMTITDIRAQSRRWHQKLGGLGLIVIDQLSLIVPHNNENRQVAVAGISRGIKLLAKQMQVPVVIAAQLNRNPESRSDKRPMMSDLRESGQIEADADVIILIHREDYHDKESSRAGEADFIVDKNRNGPTDTVTVAAQLHLSKFVDMALPES